MNKVVKKIVTIAIAVAVFVGWQLYHKDRASDEIKSQTHALMTKLPSYEQEREYIDKIFNSSYESAFDSSYQVGKKRRAAKFDSQKYIVTVFDNMISAAKKDSKEKIATELELIKILVKAENDKK